MATRPPCPDPDLFIWVNTPEGGYWRRRRGTIKKATLNSAFERNTKSAGYINKAGNTIMGKLDPHLKNLTLGRSYSTLIGELRKSYNESGKIHYDYLNGFDLQPKHKMERLLKHVYTIEASEEMVALRIPIDETTIENTGGLVTHYFFELILLQGDAGTDNSLRIDVDTSDVYETGRAYGDCLLTVHPIKKPWMVLLKLNRIETPTAATMELAVSASNYGMKVVATGR